MFSVMILLKYFCLERRMRFDKFSLHGLFKAHFKLSNKEFYGVSKIVIESFYATMNKNKEVLFSKIYVNLY